jgi:hypothetical protein
VSSSPYSSERHKPFDPDISEEDRRLADEVSEDYDQRRQAEAETRNQKLQQIIDGGTPSFENSSAAPRTGWRCAGSCVMSRLPSTSFFSRPKA